MESIYHFRKRTSCAGNKIQIRIELPNGNGITKNENRELRWLGKFLFSGLFDGEHKSELIENGNGTVTFVQSERFTGILVWLFNPQKTQQSFVEMNKKLKELSEQ